jgi:hexosaminidase
MHFMTKLEGQTSHFGIIPAPREVTWSGGHSAIKSLQFGSSDLSGYLKKLIQGTQGAVMVKDGKNNVRVLWQNDMQEEQYEIQIDHETVTIKAGSPKAIQYGVVTLIQMVRFFGFPLPAAVISDRPEFSYRGMHLDVARHLFTVEEIKKYIDYLAFYKYNHFHWHLTDDQGWRIEIKKYPKLQEISAFRDETLTGHYNDIPHQYDGKKYGGYYTQEDIKQIVLYAAERNVHVIPEIEMPGHALAALAAYPELGCTGGPYEVGTKWGVFDEVFCPTENTFLFLQDVIDEVIELFPYHYIHIGGDECPKVTWEKSDICQKIMQKEGLKNAHELQSYFIRRMEEYIQSKGKKIIGWDEILEGGLAPNATVMSWRGNEGGMEAARLGHDAIMTPGSHCYFDYYQSTSPDEPLAIGGYTPLEKVYHWKPVPEKLEPEFRKHIIGGQANVWTEYMKDFSRVEYMAFARGMAMAEALWTTPRDYMEFTNRFLLHQDAWVSGGANVANHVYELKPLTEAGTGRPVTIRFDLPGGKGVWHEWGSRSEKGSAFTLAEKGLHHFSVDGNFKNTRPLSLHFDPHLATKAKVHMNPLPSPKYPGNGPGSIVNGITGSDEKYGGTEWLGFEGKNVQVLMEWKEAVDIKKVRMRFFKGEGQWIYLPKSVEIFASVDGRSFESLKTIKEITSQTKVAELELPASMKNIRFLKIDIQNYGIIPSGAQGAGHGAWLFLDEVVVE